MSSLIAGLSKSISVFSGNSGPPMLPHHPFEEGSSRAGNPIDHHLSTGVACLVLQTVLMLSPHCAGLVLPRTMWDIAVPIASLVK